METIRDHADKLEMKNDRQRVFLFTHPSDEIVCNAGTECGHYPECEVKRRNPCVKLLDQQNAEKCHRIKKPLERPYFFAQQYNRDHACEYR